MSRILVIDGNHLLFRSQSVFNNARNKEGLPIGGLFGMLNSVKSFLIQNDDHSSVIFVVDAGIPQFRFDICPEYKAQRKAARSEEEEKIYQDTKLQVPHVRKVTRWLGCGFAKTEGWEGDDCIAALVLKRFPNHGITIMSADKDFIELLDGDRVKLYDPLSHEYRKPDPGYMFKRLMNPKASDNIKGVVGVGKVYAEKLVEEWRSAWEASHPKTEPWLPHGKAALKDFINWCEYITTAKTEVKEELKIQKLAKKVADAQEKMWANYAVTCMRRIAKRVNESMTFRINPVDMDKFEETAKEYGLRPVLEDMILFRTVFERLDHSFLLPQES